MVGPDSEKRVDVRRPEILPQSPLKAEAGHGDPSRYAPVVYGIVRVSQRPLQVEIKMRRQLVRQINVPAGKEVFLAHSDVVAAASVLGARYRKTGQAKSRDAHADFPSLADRLVRMLRNVPRTFAREILRADASDLTDHEQV